MIIIFFDQDNIVNLQLLTHFFPTRDSNKMLNETPERLHELEHMCSDNEMNSSNSLRGKPLLEDLIREEILRSKEREKKEKPNNLRKVDGRQVISFI